MKERAVPHWFLDRLVIVIAVGLIGAALTYFEVVRPSISDLQQQLGFSRPAMAPAPAKVSVEPPKPAPAPLAQPEPTPPAPAPAPAAPAAKTATTISFVHLRSGKSTSTPIIQDLDGGTVVTLRNDSDPTWQGVTVNGRDGYIYKTYLQY